jgi:hypothetical protein
VTTTATPDHADVQPVGALTRSDWLLRTLPLASVFVWLVLVYWWEAWGHTTPWLFTDELELAQLSRSIAAHGFPAHRREDAHTWETLYTIVTVPAWWLHSTKAAYGAIKAFNVVLMTSTLFPVYGLARMVVSRRTSLFAGATAAAIPPVAYALQIVEEPLAYPYAALGLYAIAKALVTRRPRWIGAAVVISLVAPLVRGELVVVPFVLFLATVLTIWSSAWFRERRSTWTLGDYAGLLTLVAGLIFVGGAIASTHSHEWYVSTYLYQDRMLTLGLQAAGVLTIGLGVFPVIAGLAVLWRPREETPTTETRVFRAVAFSAIVGYGMYTAVKAAYLSTVFATRIEERNLIYLAPVLLVGTALWVERRQVSRLAVLAAAAFVAYLLASTPYLLDYHLYSDALGAAILEQANRILAWTQRDCEIALFTVFGCSVAALLGSSLARLQRRRALASTAALAATFSFAWCFTGELSAAASSNSISRSFSTNLGAGPYDWVDRVTHGAPTLYLGEEVADQTAEWGMEFWNRSIQHVWSLDRSTQDSGPGESITPNIQLDGRLDPNPDSAYAVEERGIDLAGKVVQTHVYWIAAAPHTWRLVRLDSPARLLSATVGLYADGWSGPSDSAYTRYSSRGRGGTLIVRISRKEGGPDAPTPVEVRLGTLVIGASTDYPQLGTTTVDVKRTLPMHGEIVVRIPTTLRRFQAQTTIADKFVPSQVNPRSTDGRTLGAVVTYRFVPAR